ncbi:endolytic transglycosylase MltG [Streptomyces sp. NPDC059900]|uniref:endolytic transglycosylase MltG n=3 Tax=Streptomyces sp. NPDC059900 TaxID=3155816 RepID=UPI00343ECD76
MTEYGRGPGSEPWHPEDPLYGDGGWGGQQAAGGPSPYGGQGQYHPQQPQQAQYDDWSTGSQQGYGQQQYGGHAGQQQYNAGPEQQYNPGPEHQYNAGPEQQHNGGWDTGRHGQAAYAADPSDPYGNQPGGYGAESPDYYGTPDAYPPPEPPSRRRPDPEPQQDWDPGPDQGEHAFFSGADDDEDEYDDEPPGRRGGRGDRRGGRGGKKPKKRRSGCACLVVTLVFAGGLGGVGYFGYQFYQDRFGTAPDFAGEGTGLATVDIPKGAGGYTIGQKLKDAGVVKSVDAFVSAQAQNPKGDSIQDGVYVLKKEMSAKSAVELMLSPKSRNNLIIPEGKRNSWVYSQIDTRLELKKGTTKGVAKKDWKSLGLPDWANTNKDIKDPLEGFLYPSSYPVAKGQKPQDVLKKMVSHATVKYDELGLKAKAAQLNLKDPLQVLTVASLVQAEGKYKHDFDKVATVVYNRLKPNNTETYGLLDFDSTVNYAKAESTLETGTVDDLRKFNDPYNTYKIKGLPPGPIGNPGDEALNSALNPAKGNWYYFVSINADKTLFAETNEQHERNRQKYLEEQKKNSG